MTDNQSSVTSKGQVTIPSKLRNKFNIEKGNKVAFIETPDGILIKPVTEVRKLRGIFKHKVDINRMESTLAELRSEWSINNE